MVQIIFSWNQPGVTLLAPRHLYISNQRQLPHSFLSCLRLTHRRLHVVVVGLLPITFIGSLSNECSQSSLFYSKDNSSQGGHSLTFTIHLPYSVCRGEGNMDTHSLTMSFKIISVQLGYYTYLAQVIQHECIHVYTWNIL